MKRDWIYEQYVKEISMNKLLETDFYYNENGQMVMTESYHIRRGSCCGSKCLNCPYSESIKGNKVLKQKEKEG